MSGPITFELITFLIITGSAVAGVWWFLFNSILAARRDLQKDIQRLQQEFTNYKLEVAQHYASVEHLKEVEIRLMGAIDKQTDKLDTMPDKFARIVQQTMQTIKRS